MRDVDERFNAPHVDRDRQVVYGSIDGNRSDQSRSGHYLLSNGVTASWATEHRILGQLWTGERESRLARIRRLDILRQRSQRRSTPLRSVVERRLSPLKTSRSQIS